MAENQQDKNLYQLVRMIGGDTWEARNFGGASIPEMERGGWITCIGYNGSCCYYKITDEGRKVAKERRDEVSQRVKVVGVNTPGYAAIIGSMGTAYPFRNGIWRVTLDERVERFALYWWLRDADIEFVR